MPSIAVALLAVGTFAFRLAGPVIGRRVKFPDSLQRLLTLAATVLLVALVATSALTEKHGFAGWSRPAGVLVACSLAYRKASFPVVVLAAAATTALLRLGGLS